MFSKIWTKKSTESYSQQIEQLQTEFQQELADAVLIGAGSGLSASAGFTYSGERFQTYFGDFAKKYGIRDMYSGGFYPYSSLEEYWAWWSRHIYYNRYVDIPKPTYQKLLEIVKDKDYFVLTTNVDHCFQKAGFDKKKLFYTQEIMGCGNAPIHAMKKHTTIKKLFLQMLEEQSDMRIPSELVPHCPVCGKPMTMNLRCDNTFVQDEGWYAAQDRYTDFLFGIKD